MQTQAEEISGRGRASGGDPGSTGGRDPDLEARRVGQIWADQGSVCLRAGGHAGEDLDDGD